MRVERIFSIQKEKILEISKIFSNPFWKDVFYSLYLAKPIVKLNIKECLSLDLLNFVSIDYSGINTIKIVKLTRSSSFQT
jgi:hypothetical protein